MVFVVPIVNLWTMTCLPFWALTASVLLPFFVAPPRGDKDPVGAAGTSYMFYYVWGVLRFIIVIDPSADISYGFVAASEILSIELSLDFESVPTVLFRWVFT